MERDGKDIMRRLNSDKLMSPTPDMLRELPLSNIGERAERYHRIDLGPLVGLKHEAEDDLEKIKLRIIKAPKTRSPGPSADDRVASYYRLEADDAQDNLHEDKDGCCELFSAPPNDVNEKKENIKKSQKEGKSWKKRLLKLFSWCSGSAERCEN
nr:uncharacterized protein LOC117688932 isoform X5 [Crassostrea gigas]